MGNCKTVKQQQQKQKKQQQIAKIGQKESEECTSRKHSIVKQGKRVCISQIPLVECGSGCAPRTNIEKSIPFTCLPENRPQVTKMYQDKVKRGEVLPELRSILADIMTWVCPGDDVTAKGMVASRFRCVIGMPQYFDYDSPADVETVDLDRILNLKSSPFYRRMAKNRRHF